MPLGKCCYRGLVEVSLVTLTAEVQVSLRRFSLYNRYVNKEDEYIKLAYERAWLSYKDGEFPAGAVVVSADGEVFESDDSFGWNHAEAQVVDKAVSFYGPDLDSCTLYTTMMPCVGCLSKIYWGGIRNVVYVLDQEEVTSTLCYDSSSSVATYAKTLHETITLNKSHHLHDQILKLYRDWEKQIGYTKET